MIGRCARDADPSAAPREMDVLPYPWPENRESPHNTAGTIMAAPARPRLTTNGRGAGWEGDGAGRVPFGASRARAPSHGSPARPEKTINQKFTCAHRDDREVTGDRGKECELPFCGSRGPARGSGARAAQSPRGSPVRHVRRAAERDGRDYRGESRPSLKIMSRAISSRVNAVRRIGDIMYWP